MIYFSDKKGNTLFSGHNGQDIPANVNKYAIKHILADGDELDRIHAFGYPDYGKKVQEFYGERATEIALNW